MRTLLKTINYRIIGCLTTATIVFIATGNFKLAGAVAMPETLVKMLIYYLHEKVWDRNKSKPL